MLVCYVHVDVLGVPVRIVFFLGGCVHVVCYVVAWLVCDAV